jgi:eukaryotic-like serine/threonine-protein kinase
MTVSKGTRLGPYHVERLLGTGGMGEVYRARDTTLNRDVAIKVLLPAVTADPERLSRFSREAQVLASLNHPHIAQIYGLEDAGGAPALVLELVDGPTLADRIAHGAIPISEALPIAAQIADALEAAHEQGIIHRDLKPANIKVREDGTVKVLDFGLAKAFDPSRSTGPDPMNSPTISLHATHVGVILGTAAYMSPEQAKGRAVDRRADLWAFGAVLYEMLTGRRAFGGDEVSEILAHVLMEEPDWNALPARTPLPIRRLLRRCLEKDRKRRLDSAAAARFEVEEAMTAARENGNGAADSRAAWRRALPWAVAGTLGVSLGLALFMGSLWTAAPQQAPVRVNVQLGAEATLATLDRGSAAILAPNGQALVFVGQRRTGPASLFLRRLDQLDATPMPGTEGAHEPFFSPDGQWVAFFADAKLKKVALSGGAPVTICEIPDGRGGWWAADGSIVFAPFFAGMDRSGLLRVSSNGGRPTPVTSLADGEVAHGWPQVLPGGAALLYASHSSRMNWDDATLVVQRLPAGERKIVQRGGTYGRYLASGHIVYLHDAKIFAVPFDLERLEVTGPPFLALDGVGSNPNGGSAQFAASETGTFVYLSRPIGSAPMGGAPIQWMDRAGRRTPLRATPTNWGNPHFSPDGTRLAVEINDGKQLAVWVYDWAHDRESQLTLNAAQNQKPVWTPNGRRIVFWSNRDVQQNLYWQRADGTGDAQRLTDSQHPQSAASWHPGGKILAFQETRPQTGADLMVVAIEGDELTGWKPGTPTSFLSTPAIEREPMFSPDGKWLAYQANDTGRFEIYVRPFPGPGGTWLISTAGGVTPTWSRTRRELLYRSPENQLMVAAYTASGDSFRAEKPRPWAEGYIGPQTGQRSFDLHPDGERVAVAPELGSFDRPQDRLVVIFNFFDELRRMAAPTAKR